MCFFSPIRNDPKKTHKQNFGAHPVPGQSRKFVYVYVFFLSLSLVIATEIVITTALERLPFDALSRCTMSFGLAGCVNSSPPLIFRSLGNGVRKNGVRNRYPYRRCGVDTEIPYRLPFWREFCWFLPVRVAPGVDTEFPYRVRIVDRGVDCRDPLCRNRFRFLEFCGNFRGFGGIWANSGKFGKFRENSGELSGIQWGLVWRLVWIQWEFLGDFGATPDFRENLGFGVVSGDSGGQKVFAQIARPSGLFCGLADPTSWPESVL